MVVRRATHRLLGLPLRPLLLALDGADVDASPRTQDRRVRRAAMDYIDHVEVVRHAGFEAFYGTLGEGRLVLFTTKASQSAYEYTYSPDDVLLFGKESAGVPDHVVEASDAKVRLPMRSEVRSLNVATSAAIALAEALRQTGTLPR